MFWHLFVFAKTQVGVTTIPFLTDLKRARSHQLSCHLASQAVGGAKGWDGIATCEMFKIRWQTDGRHVTSDFTHRSTVRSGPFGAGSALQTTSLRNDTSRLRRLGVRMLAGIFVGCAVHTRGGWTGDLFIADWEELEDPAASDSHVERFRSQDVDGRHV